MTLQHINRDDFELSDEIAWVYINPEDNKEKLEAYTKKLQIPFPVLINAGLKKDVSPERIKNYTDWFYETYVVSHFSSEESLIFPILGNDHKLIKKALADHRRLVKLFEKKEDLKTCMSLGRGVG